jgi:conjugative relaxase-like TrwC/TraI family protein
VLSIGKLGCGPTAAEYYLRRQAGCDLDYYAGDGERHGVWCGHGAAALGLSGELTVDGERVLRALLAGEAVDGSRLVTPVLRADPRSRVPADVVVAAITAAAESAGRPVEQLFGDEGLVASFAKASSMVERAARRPAWPAPGLPADQAGALLRAAGLDPAQVLRGPRGRDRFTAAVRRLTARVDVRLAGLDFTLSPPKSATLLFALGTPEVSAAVRAAHVTAVDAALEYMEGACAVGLRGHHGRNHAYVSTAGLIGVAFEHRTSRENDPQLHTHVVVANLLHGVDGKWSAVNTREAFRHARTGGFVYQAVLRGELTRELGVDWGPVRKGQADIVGVPKPLLSLFSKRRKAIAAALERTGRTDASAARAATLATRPDKQPADGSTLRSRWAAQARDAGFDPADLADALHQVGAPVIPAAAEITARLVADDGLTRRRSTFDRRDVMRAVCEAIPAGAAVTLMQLRELATAVVRDRETVALLPDVPVAERRYSTAQLLATERTAQAEAVARLGDGLATVDRRTVRSILASGDLSPEQAAMVRQVTGSGAGVEVVVGPAGSGKTRALAAARVAWEATGLSVTGAALSAIAARVLEDGAGLRASSLTRLLADVTRVDPTTGEPAGLPAGGVLVVDEAGMIGTRLLAELIRTTAAYRTKLVLVGDPHQLAEIDAGGLFASLVEVLPAARLAGNQRQTAGWERTALAELRDGDVLAAVEAYRRHDRLRVADTIDDLRAELMTDYQRARTEVGPGQALVVASSRADARRLNRDIRAMLVGAGSLGDDELVVHLGPDSERSYRVGDEVVVTANDYRRALLNGSRGQVCHVDLDARTVSVRLGDGRDVTLAEGYLRTGRLAHAYALTCHKAQGMTVQVSLLWGSSALTRETGYVAMSRGREANYVYATWDGLRRDFSADVDRPRVGDAPTSAQRDALTRAALVDRLDTSGRQRLAASWWRPRRSRAADSPATPQTASGSERLLG